jgi:aspartyl-tRNA(Asn)/glutamyl-tRNA(Gln) amidotransferase subunit A
MITSLSKNPTITEIHQLYKTQPVTVAEVSDHFLALSKEIDQDLNAVSSYTPELASQQSQKLDQLLQEARDNKDLDSLFTKYPLFGVPFFVKSIIQVEGQEAHASSKILKGFKSPYSATPYLKCEQAGAVLIGIAHLDEFACGASGENSAYGPTGNAYDSGRVPGGSSSGPATVVASGQAVFSLGTDTGGSIRQPSAFSNTVGLKPTQGLVSRYGTMAMASSLDQVGPIANTVKDAKTVISVIAGQDPSDQTSLDSQDLLSKLKVDSAQGKKYTIGLPKEFFIDGIHPQIQTALEVLIEDLKKQGHKFVEVDLPLIKYAISVYYMIMPVELSANLERYDGVRFALQDDNPDNQLFYSQRENFGDEITRRIILGAYASSAGYYDAYYNQAQKVRYQAYQDFQEAFKKCDLMLTPTTPEFPFKIGDKSNDPLKMYLSDVFTCGINPVKIPGLNVPLGTFVVDLDGQKTTLPTGVQLLAPELCEDRLFDLGGQVESLQSTGE